MKVRSSSTLKLTQNGRFWKLEGETATIQNDFCAVIRKPQSCVMYRLESKEKKMFSKKSGFLH